MKRIRPKNSDPTFQDEYTQVFDDFSAVGKDRRPLYQRYDAEHSTYDPNAIRSFTDWVPVVGDIGYGLDAYNAFNNKDYAQAGMLGGMLLMPHALRSIKTPLKNISKKAFQLYDSSYAARSILPIAAPATILSASGIYDMITSDDILDGSKGLLEATLGSTLGAYGGLKLASKLEPIALKRLYGVNRNGIVPKFSNNTIREDALFSNADWSLFERDKASKSLTRYNFNKLNGGDSYAIIHDDGLSKDSAPLYLAQLARHSNVGDIHTIKNAAGGVTMQRLNNYGENHSINDINRMIQAIRDTGISLPDAKQIGRQIYMPQVYITKR